jgi:RNase P/RNase MRP subunit POP5
MVVKEKRGRRRYVAFEVTSEELLGEEALLSAMRSLCKGRKPPKIIQFDGHLGVVRCDLRDLTWTKELLVSAGAKLGSSIGTLSTSGTLRALRERLGLPEGERRPRVKGGA